TGFLAAFCELCELGRTCAMISLALFKEVRLKNIQPPRANVTAAAMLKTFETTRARGFTGTGSGGGLILATRLLIEALLKIPRIPVLNNADEEVAGIPCFLSELCSSKDAGISKGSVEDPAGSMKLGNSGTRARLGAASLCKTHSLTLAPAFSGRVR